MGQKITLSSNIPITLPEKLSEKIFGLGFLYPCGKGLELKDGKTWFEKLCLSLNKMNALVGFQNTDLKIPEYIAETVFAIEKQLEPTTLLIRYNAQTKLNDFVQTFSPEKNNHSFNDRISKSLIKGNPMVIIGERSLKETFPYFEEKFGLKCKINFILHHEIAHNIDASRNYKRGSYSLKDIMEDHLSGKVESTTHSPYISNAELYQTKKIIKQIWTLSLEHYADTLGFLNMRNQLLEEKIPYSDIMLMLDGLIHERKNTFKKNVELLNKKESETEQYIDFEEKYKCMNHLTVNALTDLKEKLEEIGNRQLNNTEIELLTIKIVTKADLKSLYIMKNIDSKTAQLLEKLLTSKTNDNGILETCENKKPKFQRVVNKLLTEPCINEIDKYITIQYEEKSFYDKINQVFGINTSDLKIINNRAMHKKIQEVRGYSIEVQLKNRNKWP